MFTEFHAYKPHRYTVKNLLNYKQVSNEFCFWNCDQRRYFKYPVQMDNIGWYNLGLLMENIISNVLWCVA